MKEIILEDINEVIYYGKLKNGLDVYLYSKDNCTNNYVTFTTKFGSIYDEFVPVAKKKMIKVPHGVAHFLEHKLFAQENGPQPEEFFAKSGALCNAYTTFKNTTYLFSGPYSLEKNVCFLLDYVQSPFFTDENVESEKGIISQEIHMCDDDPNDVLYEYIRKNAFFHNPFRDSIIGTIDDISSITKDILYTCYHTFYHPSNMFLVVTGNFDVNELWNVISLNQENKEWDKASLIEVKKFKEPDKVVKEKEIVSLTTQVPKVAYSVKISLSHIHMDLRKYNLYLYIIFSCLFDDTSLFDEKLKEKGIIANSTSINFLNCDTHQLVSLINETSFYDSFIEEVKECLQHISLSSDDLERKKRVLISNELFSFENIEVVNDMIVDNIIFDNRIENHMISILKSLNMDELEDIIHHLDVSHSSVVILKNNQDN